MKSDEQQISQLMEPLGLHHKRAQILMKFSSELVFTTYVFTVAMIWPKTTLAVLNMSILDVHH